MEITFYNNNSELNKMEKNITQLFTLNGTLKDECSITDPVILIESTSRPNADYIYIPDFSRYYFITNVVHVGNTLWRISMHCDVISSFKNYLNNCEVTLERQENDYNLMIPDEKIPLQENTTTVTKIIGDTSLNWPVILLTSQG